MTTPIRAAAPAGTGADAQTTSSTKRHDVTGTSTNYNVSQRAAARWAETHARRWHQPPASATADQVLALGQKVDALSRLFTGEQIR